jgi:hypothetical protein
LRISFAAWQVREFRGSHTGQGAERVSIGGQDLSQALGRDGADHSHEGWEEVLELHLDGCLYVLMCDERVVACTMKVSRTFEVKG